MWEERVKLKVMLRCLTQNDSGKMVLVTCNGGPGEGQFGDGDLGSQDGCGLQMGISYMHMQTGSSREVWACKFPKVESHHRKIQHICSNSLQQQSIINRPPQLTPFTEFPVQPVGLGLVLSAALWVGLIPQK